MTTPLTVTATIYQEDLQEGVLCKESETRIGNKCLSRTYCLCPETSGTVLN